VAGRSRKAARVDRGHQNRHGFKTIQLSFQNLEGLIYIIMSYPILRKCLGSKVSATPGQNHEKKLAMSRNLKSGEA
jgi:hypothetical protein